MFGGVNVLCILCQNDSLSDISPHYALNLGILCGGQIVVVVEGLGIFFSTDCLSDSSGFIIGLRAYLDDRSVVVRLKCFQCGFFSLKSAFVSSFSSLTVANGVFDVLFILVEDSNLGSCSGYEQSDGEKFHLIVKLLNLII